MKAQIITIGDEILIGQIVNTNASYIGEKLTYSQITVSKVSSVGDEEKAILDEFESALSRNDLIIVTGGLGPTHDDITRKCIAGFFNSELEMNEQVLADVKVFFEKRNRPLTKINEEQALVPKIAKPIRNFRGTAPGFWIEKDGKIFISLPGVPFEMKGMMEGYVLPKLNELNPARNVFFSIKTLLTTGIGESSLYEIIKKVDNIFDEAKIAFLPNQFGTKVRLIVSALNEQESINRLLAVEQKIRAAAGKYIYGKDEETLEEIVGNLLIERGLRLAVAESCTGGLVTNRLTNVSGSSKYLERGLVSYSNAAKVEMLHVNEDIIHEFGAVSLQVALQMAEGVKAVSGADIGISLTGIMGPTGATPDKPVGLVYIGICDDTLCTALKFNFGDDRLLNKDRASQAALEMIRRRLLGIPYDE